VLFVSLQRFLQEEMKMRRGSGCLQLQVPDREREVEERQNLQLLRSRLSSGYGHTRNGGRCSTAMTREVARVNPTKCVVLPSMPPCSAHESFFYVEVEFFYIYFITILQKIHGPPQILQKYKSAAVAHGVRDVTPPLAWPRRGAVRHGVKSLALWATA
jgi:hypothetical protein